MIDPKGLGALIVFGLNGREKYAGNLSNESIEGAIVYGGGKNSLSVNALNKLSTIERR
jgi:hypothetical protein